MSTDISSPNYYLYLSESNLFDLALWLPVPEKR